MTEHQTEPKYRCIGAGFCGTVWAQGNGPAIKRENGGPERSLPNDYVMHQRALDSIERLNEIKAGRDSGSLANRYQVHIPKCHRFLTANDPWWNDNIRMFPNNYEPCNAIISDHIPPFPEEVRKLLVKRYCHPKLQEEILGSVANKDCLIRPYLGRRRTQRTEVKRTPRFSAFSLRNYPLHEDQMEDLGVPLHDMQTYASMMGEALATLHWLGEIDGNDIEFVLAPSPGQGNIKNVLGEHSLWMLDFDLCRSMSMDIDGVRQAVSAYWRNDPFYPRPMANMWKDFRSQYLESSEQIIRACCIIGPEERLCLARKFIDLVEEEK
ncbi:hypothetical protein BO85DRAFT_393056 [Aspergillus piperis CBS 112811]|uniref:DUF3669 domain-containing protein n=1 Tax=Aspergillus piperis CBS 112811 TaxID=1448313 RepID=A0A8G1VPC4_9EURO|nr:hypothetical protein BO85DRAFT_393056 [Aspergillus piperis CBS 112811]RAH59512.1 hypothetical protein BO85DRAFT_393056 [Aspergillus piperis CBS 112811]